MGVADVWEPAPGDRGESCDLCSPQALTSLFPDHLLLIKKNKQKKNQLHQCVFIANMIRHSICVEDFRSSEE